MSSQRTLFRILDVKKANQRKSLQGIDNIAADGSLGFERIKRIVLELESLGVEKDWVDDILKKLRSARLYLTTDYAVHCNEETPCPDHCRKFALSDPTDEQFQELCSHEHSLFCERCEDLKGTLYDIEQKICSFSSHMYSEDQKGDFLYDFNKGQTDIFRWKCHIMRSCNQERGKQDALQMLDNCSALVVMDWAMKFLQLRHREKQTEWYGKRGISWHVSSLILKDSKENENVSVSTFAHLIDACTQDWFAVCSIFEDLLTTIQRKYPHIKKVYLRSDEAGCYHNNMLLAALKDVGKRTKIDVVRYDYSEPQFGKDICDRILCPMKLAIRNYCNEGHDILRAEDMREALIDHPVKGTTCSVNQIDEAAQSIKVKNIAQFNNFHNFQFEEDGIRMWRAYGIGTGKVLPYSTIVVHPQKATGVKTLQQFFPFKDRTMVPENSKETEKQVFECTIPGCVKAFKRYENLNLHLETGKHNNNIENETVYDKIRGDWAEKFMTIDMRPQGKQKSRTKAAVAEPTHETLVTSASHSTAAEYKMGWALKQGVASARFSKKVREYLIAKFDAGEKTGRKANPGDVEMEMRNSREENNSRRFTREEWLTSTQIKSFFSRLAAARRKAGNVQALESAPEEIDENLINEIAAGAEEENRRKVLDEIAKSLQVQHPIIYDVYDLCELNKQNKLQIFNVNMMKTICSYFEIPFKSRDRKAELLKKIQLMISECDCNS
jgi:hypothetical protein